MAATAIARSSPWSATIVTPPRSWRARPAARRFAATSPATPSPTTICAGDRRELRALLRGVRRRAGLQALAGTYDYRGGLHVVLAPDDEPAPAPLGRALRGDVHPAQAARGARTTRVQRRHRHERRRHLGEGHCQPGG